MSYNQVGTCRLYINVIEWLDSLGFSTLLNSNIQLSLFRTLPVNPTLYFDATAGNLEVAITLKGMTANGFVALLGHNMATTSTGFGLESGGTPLILTSVVNGDPSSGYDGFSIVTFTGRDDIDEFTLSNNYSVSVAMGSIIIGNYFDLHSPDLNLTLSYQTGTKTIETKGGSSLSNTMWRPPMWGETLGPWELSDPANPTNNQALAHSSKRSWNLSFSFLSKENTFPKYNALNRYTNENLDSNELLLTEEETLLDSDDFFSAVWNKVGTALPMIFQPDNTVNEFAIVKIANKSLKVTQVANQIYTIKLKLNEVW